jgi:hypothetical protein
MKALIPLFALLLAGCETVDGIRGTPENFRNQSEYHMGGFTSGQTVTSGDDRWNVFVSSKDANRFLVMVPRGPQIAKAFIPIVPLFLDITTPPVERVRAGAETFIAKNRPGCSIDSERKLHGLPGYAYAVSCAPITAQSKESVPF